MTASFFVSCHLGPFFPFFLILFGQPQKNSIDICSTATDLEYRLGALTMQEISLKHELSSSGQAININALNNWEASVNEYLADLQAGIGSIKQCRSPDRRGAARDFLDEKKDLPPVFGRQVFLRNL